MVKIGAVLLYVDQFEAAVEFYRDVIGLKVADIDPGPGYELMVDFAYFESGGAALEILEREIHGTSVSGTGRGGMMMGLEVGDLAAACDRLESTGVDVGSTVERAWGRYIMCTDPEGNPLQIYQFAS